MYNHQLDTFLKVAEAGSFSAAADQLYISSSAVIQQINILERDLKVLLFTRTKRGVALTEAGEYLAEQARDYIRQSVQIRKNLIAISTRYNTLCVGTSLMEKCRLLYDLWVLFSQEGRGYDVRMVLADFDRSLLEDAELVESVRDDAPWQQGWTFLELCRVPVSCAVSHDHPLSGKERFTWEDLRGRELVLVDRGAAPLAALRQRLEEAGCVVREEKSCTGSLVWECSIRKQILIAPACWEDILFDLKMHPAPWDLTLPYGFFYRENESLPLREFIAFVEQLYAQPDPPAYLPQL